MTSKITIFQHPGFGGASHDITDSISYLGSIGFNDQVSSIKVVGSVWVGYEHANYNGRQYILEEGEYRDLRSYGGNDQLSSLKKLNPDIGDPHVITLYQHTNYGGRGVTLDREINDLRRYNFTDEASSLRVKSGIWILYEHPNFNGKQYVVTEGSYPSPGSWRGVNDQISSLRPIREPYFPTEVLKIEYNIPAGNLRFNPEILINLSQTNDTSVEQTATWSTKRTVTTTKTFEWHWQNSTAVSASTTFSTGVPFIAEGKISIGITNTFSIGEKRGQQNTQSDEWSFELPATVKAKTRLRAQAIIKKGKIDVPFLALLRKGNKVWWERGTYKGTQRYDVEVELNETPL